jgi:hypothetical protein
LEAASEAESLRQQLEAARDEGAGSAAAGAQAAAAADERVSALEAQLQEALVAGKWMAKKWRQGSQPASMLSISNFCLPESRFLLLIPSTRSTSLGKAQHVIGRKRRG